MEKVSRTTVLVETRDPSRASLTLHSIAELDEWLDNNNPEGVEKIVYTVSGTPGEVHYQFDMPGPTEMQVSDDGGLVVTAHGPNARQSLDAALRLYERINLGATITAFASGHARSFSFSNLYRLDVWLQTIASGYVLTSIGYHQATELVSEFQHPILHDGYKAVVIVQDRILRVYGYGENARESLRVALEWFEARTGRILGPEDEIPDSCEE
jgi:hypothetical protein